MRLVCCLLLCFVFLELVATFATFAMVAFATFATFATFANLFFQNLEEVVLEFVYALGLCSFALFCTFATIC